MRTMRVFVTLSVGLWSLAAAAGTTIEVGGKPVELARLKRVEVTRPDIQLAAQAHYRGVPLSALVAAAKDKKGDLVVLRFANGMHVPLPRDPRLWKELDPFIALEVEVDGAWTTDFPSISKPGAEERDVRPLVFEGNKFVVATATHPAVSEAVRLNGFTPFSFVDSLVGVDLVQSGEREKALRGVGAPAPAVAAGFGVFMGHCQFCHGVKRSGARYGRDFGSPSLASTAPRDLLLHVRYRDHDAPERGLMMPFFKDVSADDVKALLAWLKAIGT